VIAANEKKYSIKDFFISKQEIKKSDTIMKPTSTQGVLAIGYKIVKRKEP
jgi:hypothetical protein